ncbi:SMI1/KNR4 family protein, partial [Catellatospora coxensis]
MGDTDWSGVRERVESLRARPGHERRFGADLHGFTLAPALGDGDLADLEAWLGVELPADYRRFLTQVAAGGAGPDYGINTVRRIADGDGWRWHGDCGDLTDVARLGLPFLVERPFGELLDELDEREPRPEDFTDETAFKEATWSWQDRMWEIVAVPEFSQGAIYLVDEGCNRRYWLVVSGPAAGTVWYDSSCDWADMNPVENDAGEPMGFGEWYLDWLDSTERYLALWPNGGCGPIGPQPP